jgi:hypothetical protein
MIEKWNSNCFCVRLDSAALRAALNAQSRGLGPAKKPHSLRMKTSSPASELLRHAGITSRLK